jgi:D-alanyl-D-alanine dipeptidase
MENREMEREERPIPNNLVEPLLDGIMIAESGEPLVPVIGGAGIHVAPAYFERGITSAPAEIFLREQVLETLQQVSARLPAGFELLVWDGLRSLETHQELVDRFRSELGHKKDRDAIVARYLTFPPNSERTLRRRPPPHTTGGAVDLTLCDSTGMALDLGAGFDQFDEASWLVHYENDSSGREIRRNRRILFWSMLDAGFAPYAMEYWHYELGTMLAAAWHGERCAEYGTAVPWAPRG